MTDVAGAETAARWAGPAALVSAISAAWSPRFVPVVLAIVALGAACLLPRLAGPTVAAGVRASRRATIALAAVGAGWIVTAALPSPPDRLGAVALGAGFFAVARAVRSGGHGSRDA